MTERTATRSAVSGQYISVEDPGFDKDTSVTETYDDSQEVPLTPEVAALLAVYRDDENAARSVVKDMSIEAVKELCKVAIKVCVVCEEAIEDSIKDGDQETVQEPADGWMNFAREAVRRR